MPSIDLSWVGYSVYPPGGSYGPYTAASHELVWIDHGSAVLETDGDLHSLAPGSVVFSRPGERNLYRWDDERVTRHGWIHLHAPASDEWPRVRRFAPHGVVLGLLAHVRWLELERPAQWRDMAVHALDYATWLFVTGAAETDVVDDEGLHPVIDASLRHVAACWSTQECLQPPPLSELARAAAVSPEHLCRVYKSNLGHGPIGLLRLVRLKHAATLLARSGLPIAQIARRAGFENQFHFSRTFKTEFGVAPSDFRAQQHPGPALPAAIQRLCDQWL